MPGKKNHILRDGLFRLFCIKFRKSMRRISMPLTKIDIIDAIYTEMGMNKKESAKMVESFFDIIKEELTKGDDVMISGFGKWSVRSKRSRTGRNPQTGKPLTIEPKKVITFKSSKIIREEINDKRKHSKND
jgi:integration host factor subunit alpha